MTDPFEDGQLDAMVELIEAGVPTDLIIWATQLPYWLVEYAALTINHEELTMRNNQLEQALVAAGFQKQKEVRARKPRPTQLHDVTEYKLDWIHSRKRRVMLSAQCFRKLMFKGVSRMLRTADTIWTKIFLSKPSYILTFY